MSQSIAVRSAAIAVLLVLAPWRSGYAEDRTVVVEHFSTVA
jgi:hypothetical protein